jgi:ABC-type sugar transport system ATPase subunit
MSKSSPAIEACDVSKAFGHVQALDHVSLSVDQGEIVALFGDNGAGKSTLLKIMAGTYTPDEGEVLVDGKPLVHGSVHAAADAGIATVYQDLSLAPDLRVYENLFLGRELVRDGLLGKVGVLRRKAMRRAAATTMDPLDLKLNSYDIPTRSLSGGQAQGLAISRGVAFTSSVLLLDEPTASLGTGRADRVMTQVQEIAQRGIGVLIVAHDLPRIMAVAHRVVILWRGTVVLVRPAADLTVPAVVQAMVGGGVEA